MRAKGPIFSWLIVLLACCTVIQAQAAAYTLTVTADHGSVDITPVKAQYDEDETVELIPRPEAGYCFSHWSGDLRGKRLIGRVTMDSNKSITANFKTWQPPIGIPTPEFGIFETYRMYDNPASRNPDLTYHRNTEGGYYTHYVDNTDPNATDSENACGTPAKPRATLPLGVPEGSVVEIHGGPYTTETKGLVQADYRLPIQGCGTADKPVFFRGGGGSLPAIVGVLTRGISAEGTFLVAEHLDFQNGVEIWPLGYDGHKTDHVVIRHSILHKEDVRGHAVNVGWPHGAYACYQDPNLVSDVVVYGNHIYNMGQTDWSYWEEGVDPKDSYGVYIHHNAYRTWVVDNHIHNIDGGGVHLNTYGIDDNTQFPPTFSYVGRNVIHTCRECCMVSKVAWDTISSQNAFYDIHGSVGAMATAIVIESDHETPKYPYQERAWHLFNEVYDCDRGIRTHDSKWFIS